MTEHQPDQWDHGAPPPSSTPPDGPHGMQPELRQQSTNGFAVAALVLGLLGGVVLSVIFGIVALRQIRRRGQRGRGLAIAGLVASGVWTVLVAIGLFLALSTGADRDASGEIVESGSVSVEDLRTGDCLNGLRENSRVLTVDGVACGQPHEGEVYALFDLPEGEFPGEEAVGVQADRGCLDRLATASPRAYEDPQVQVFFFQPTAGSWSEGDREITCVAQYVGGRRTGSLSNAAD